MYRVCMPSVSEELRRTVAGTVPQNDTTDPPPGAAGRLGGVTPGGLGTGTQAVGVDSAAPFASICWVPFDPEGVSTIGTGVHGVTSMQYSAAVTPKFESDAPAIPRITRSLLVAFCAMP